MSKFGDFDKCMLYREKAAELMERFPQHIPNEQQISFVYNRAVDLIHIDPHTAIQACDTIIAFPENSVFHRARSLLVKSDALKRLGSQGQAGDCIRQAVRLVEHVRPQNRVDAETYPNAIRHLASHLCHVEQEFEEAIALFEQLLSMFSQRNSANELPSRFTAAQVLSELGSAYYGLDTMLLGTEHRDEALSCMRQSVEIFRACRKEELRFPLASAEAPYVNAAYAFSYYGLKQEATELIQELKEMQQDDIYGRSVVERCNCVLDELQ